MEAGTRGDPELPLRWTSKSVRKLADGLGELGHRVSYRTVGRLLRALGYSLQSNRKRHEGSDHPDRDAQFEHINQTAQAALAAGEPTGLKITVCHFPPGTSKWNRIEHRLFSHISINWRGKPLTSHQVVIDLIAATNTKTGLKVYARLDPDSYPDKIAVTNQQLAAVQIEPHSFHPEWNYTIKPRR